MPINPTNSPHSVEIDKALKEFELTTQIEQTQQTVKTSGFSDVPKMVQLMMKWFGFKEQKQAEYVLLGFVVIAIIVSIFLFYTNASKKPKIIPQFREDIEPSVRAKLPPGVFETIPSKYDQNK